MTRKAKDFTAGTKKYNSQLEETTMLDDNEITEAAATEEPAPTKKKKATAKKADDQGQKNPRITFEAPAEMFDYVKTISIATGYTMTETMQAIVKMHMDIPGNMDIYNKAVELRTALFNSKMQKD